MHYAVYFAVATPLLLGWLFWEAATLPPEPPLFVSGYERISTEPAVAAAPATPTKKFAKNEAATAD